jgi:hypothetical protein
LLQNFKALKEHLFYPECKKSVKCLILQRGNQFTQVQRYKASHLQTGFLPKSFTIPVHGANTCVELQNFLGSDIPTMSYG